MLCCTFLFLCIVREVCSLVYFREIPRDGEPAEVYNSELQRLEKEGKNTWFTAPWLFAE